MMVLAREEAVETLEERLAEEYYAPEDLEPQVDTCTSIAGACPITLAS